MGIEITNPGGVGITVELDPNSLPLTGGTLTGNLTVNTGSGSYAQVDPTEIFTQQTNAGVGQSNAYSYLYNGGVEVGDIAGKWAEFTTNQLKLANGSKLIVQTTPDQDNQGSKVELNSGGLTSIFYTNDENTRTTNYGYNGISGTAFDAPQNFNLNNNGVYGIGDGEVSWGIGINGITLNNGAGFVYHDGPNDATLTFGDGLAYVYNYGQSSSLWVPGYINFHNANGTTELNATGITFADGTVQTTSALPLTGGTLSGDVTINSADDSNLRFLYFNNLDTNESMYLRPGQIGSSSTNNNFLLNAQVLQGTGQSGNSWSIGEDGITFPDGSVQTTAVFGEGIYAWDGGTINNSIVLSDDVFGSSKAISGNSTDGNSYTGYEIGSYNAPNSQGSALKLKFGNIGEGYENQAILQQNGLTFKTADETIFAKYDTSGVTFPDGSTQGTAGLPLTGGTVTNNADTTLIQGGYVVINSSGFTIELDPLTGINTTAVINSGEINAPKLTITGEGITFPNSSVQSTAYAPTTQAALVPFALYDQEIVVTINGVTYAMLARIV